MILLLGVLELDALQVTGLSLGRGWDYAEHATIEDLPVLQLVAPQASQPTLEVRLHPTVNASTPLVDELERLASMGEILPLTTGTGRELGHFVIESLEPRWNWTTPEGELIDGSVQIKLRQHRPSEESQSPMLAVEGTEAPERTEPAAVDTDRDPSEVPLSEIVRSE